VLQLLTRAGLIVSHRGPGGGFGLGRSPAEVTLLDVVNAVEPIRRIRRCPLNFAARDCPLCRLCGRIDAGLSMLETVFACSMFADVIGDPGAGKPLCEVAAGVTCSLTSPR